MKIGIGKISMCLLAGLWAALPVRFAKADPMDFRSDGSFCSVGGGQFSSCSDEPSRADARADAPRVVGPRSARAKQEWDDSQRQVEAAEGQGREEVRQASQSSGSGQNPAFQSAGGAADSALATSKQMGGLTSQLRQRAQSYERAVTQDLANQRLGVSALREFHNAFADGRPSDAQIAKLDPKLQDYAHALRTNRDEQLAIARTERDYSRAGESAGMYRNQLATISSRTKSLDSKAAGKQSVITASSDKPSGKKGKTEAVAQQSSTTSEGGRSLASLSDSGPADLSDILQLNGNGQAGAGKPSGIKLFEAKPVAATSESERAGNGKEEQDLNKMELNHLSSLVTEFKAKIRAKLFPGDGTEGSLKEKYGMEFGLGNGAPGGSSAFLEAPLRPREMAPEEVASADILGPEVDIFRRVKSNLRKRWGSLADPKEPSQ